MSVSDNRQPIVVPDISNLFGAKLLCPAASSLSFRERGRGEKSEEGAE